MNQQEKFLIDAFEKRQGCTYENFTMFSARFENIKELKGFLKFSSNFVATNAPETLGVAFKLWQSIIKGKESWKIQKIKEVLK